MSEVSSPQVPPQPLVGVARRKSRGGFRALVDTLVCLYVAVLLFRTFEVEGYIISTGSMAPSLLGFHKRVVCPACGYEFAFGVNVDVLGAAADSTTSGRGSGDRVAKFPSELWHGSEGGTARCPNCGHAGIDVRDIPVNHGDQLLVQKIVYEFRPPHRWEVAVLKSPARPMPPFVKRIVGLPNESVQIIDGDIFADGKICRKNLPQQRALRIPVFDNDYRPKDLGAHANWTIELAPAPWQVQGKRFVISNSNQPAGGSGGAEIAWLTFRRWNRSGGTYRTSVKVGPPAADVRLPLEPLPFPRVNYDHESSSLVCVGALSAAERDGLMAANSNAVVRAAIKDLDERSHQGPVTDDYGYNHGDLGLVSINVRDLMLECDVAVESQAGELLFELSDGHQAYRLTIDRGRNEARLSLSDGGAVLRSASLPPARASRVKLEFSIFDQQAIAAIDGALLFAPWEFDSTRGLPSRMPVRIGARGISAKISALVVYRDVYYTRGQARHGVDRPIRLASNEYFVLGDNSPVSNDGRSWSDGAVKDFQLIGKPFVVHLPSRPGEIILGGRTRYIRIPDFRRMRYIH